MPAIYSHRLIARQEELDGQGHVNNVVYVVNSIERVYDAGCRDNAAVRAFPTTRRSEVVEI